MKLPRFFGRLRSRKPLLVRRIMGESMSPYLKPGQLIVARAWFARHRVRPGEVVIIRHDNKEKIKRIERVDERGSIFVIGDNLERSTDSRHFGWLHESCIEAKIIWPRVHAS